MNRAQKNARQKKTAKKYGTQFFELDERYKKYKSTQKARARLEEQYKSFVRKTNSRLKALENLSQESGYENIKQFAYSKAMMDIQNFFGEDKKRFASATSKLSNRQLEARINSMLEFLNSPSSTKKGIDRVWSSRESSIVKKYGISWDKALDVFERGIIKKYGNQLNSDLIMRVISAQEDDKKGLDNFLKEVTDKDYRVKKSPESLIKYIAQAKDKGILREEDILNYVNQ